MAFSVTDIVQSTGWKNFMAKLYGLGASVVIIGALFKIQHWPGAGIMITLGLSTEAVIFFFSAFEPLHEELDWTLVYPELAGMTDPDDMENYKEALAAGRAGSVLERFDQIVSQSSISAEDFNKLSDGLHKINNTASKIQDVTDASLAANEYVSNFKNAAQGLSQMTANYTANTQTLQDSVGLLSNSYQQTADMVSKSGQEITEHIKTTGNTLAGSYEKLTQSISGYAENISTGGKGYGSQLESLNKNLSALNAVYELQLNETNQHIKTNQAVYGEMGSMMKNLKDSVDETRKYREEMAKLSENIATLNNIYGNMLSAMNVVSRK
jgi:gliding motility-associated protein GldL